MIDAFARQLAAGGFTEAMAEGVYLARHLREYIRGAWGHAVEGDDVEPGAWPHVEPDPLTWGWHMDAICEHLEAVTAGEIENLLVNVPPGCSKSTIVSVMWPTWEWADRPAGRWFFASYDQELSTRDSLKCRNLIKSPWYQARFRHAYQLSGDQKLKTHFSNDKKGWRIASSVGGHGMGEHPDRIVVDDPHNTKQAESDVQRLATIRWWTQQMSTRGIARGVRRVIIMQRLHEGDLSAQVLEEGGFVHLMLPMRYEPRRRCVTSWTTESGETKRFEDPRKDEGELLAPDRYPEAVVEKLEKRLGPYGRAGQLQQRPAPEEGGLIRRAWFRFWAPKGSDLGPVRDDKGREYQVVELPAPDKLIQSWDMAVKKVADAIRKGKQPDPYAGGVFQRTGADVFLLDRVNDRMDINEAAKAVVDMTKRWPSAVTKLVEDKGNGPAVMQLLRGRIAGFLAVTPEGSKAHRVARAAMSQDDRDARVAGTMVALISAGNFYVPHPAIAPWVWAYINNLCTFPNAEHDDDVDMTSQALAHLQPWVLADERERNREEAAAAAAPKTLEELQRRQIHEEIRKSIEKAKKREARGGVPGL